MHGNHSAVNVEHHKRPAISGEGVCGPVEPRSICIDGAAEQVIAGTDHPVEGAFLVGRGYSDPEVGDEGMLEGSVADTVLKAG